MSNQWRTKEDISRIKRYEIHKNLYDGNHCKADGGPFAHPYHVRNLMGQNIPYQQINLLNKCSRTFADLLASDNPNFSSSNEIIESVLESIDFGIGLWEAVVQASIYGVVGLAPSKEIKLRSKNIDRVLDHTSQWGWELINPAQLFLEYYPQSTRLKQIYNRVEYKDIETSQGKINILYEELHTKNSIETRLFKVNDDTIEESLPLDYYKYINPDEAIPPETWQHNLNSFFITLLINDKLENTYYSDYTNTAKKLQEGLNNRLTQIDRILDLHADPRLVVPDSALKKDEKTGEWDFTYSKTEVLVYHDKTAQTEPYKLLTWNGELMQAVANRDTKILSMLTEFDIAPQLLSFSHLVSGTVADTSAKMEKMLHATVKRSDRKRRNITEALYLLCDNLLKLQDLDTEYSIHFAPLLPKTINEILEEQTIRKQNNLQSITDALMALDDISRDEAELKKTEILNEQANATPNLFRFNEDYSDRNG